MSMNLAKIHIRGRLGQDPVLSESKTGKKYYRLSVAVNSGMKDDRKTSWFPVYFSEKWNLEDWKKGDLVDIEGDIKTATYEKDEVKRMSVTVFPQNVLNISLAERNRDKKSAELAKEEEFSTDFEDIDEDIPDITIQ